MTAPPSTVDDVALGTAEPAFRALVGTFGLMRRVMEPYFAQFGISGSQWGVLRALQRLEDEGQPAPRLSELGERLLVRPPSVTGAVDRLQRLGLVRRSASPSDQRVRHVRLTGQGRTLVRRVLERHPAQIDAILGGLDRTEQEQLQQLLGRLAAHLQVLVEQPGERPEADGGGNGNDTAENGTSS